MSLKEKLKSIKYKKCLFVDDDMFIVDAMERFLKTVFDSYIIGINGIDGLEKFKNFQPDVVITDISMPKMDGIEMAKNILKLNPNQKIIFITGHSDLSAKDIGIECDLIYKPMNINTLVKTLNK